MPPLGFLLLLGCLSLPMSLRPRLDLLQIVGQRSNRQEEVFRSVFRHHRQSLRHQFLLDFLFLRRFRLPHNLKY